MTRPAGVERLGPMTSARIGLLGVLLAFIGMGALYAEFVPHFLPADETSHAGQALILGRGELPRLDSEVPDQIPDLQLQFEIRRQTYTANHPPLYYALRRDSAPGRCRDGPPVGRDERSTPADSAPHVDRCCCHVLDSPRPCAGPGRLRGARRGTGRAGSGGPPLRGRHSQRRSGPRSVRCVRRDRRRTPRQGSDTQPHAGRDGHGVRHDPDPRDRARRCGRAGGRDRPGLCDPPSRIGARPVRPGARSCVARRPRGRRDGRLVLGAQQPPLRRPGRIGLQPRPVRLLTPRIDPRIPHRSGDHRRIAPSTLGPVLRRSRIRHRRRSLAGGNRRGAHRRRVARARAPRRGLAASADRPVPP